MVQWVSSKNHHSIRAQSASLAHGESAAHLLEVAFAEYERRFARLQPGAADAIDDPAERKRLQELGYTVGTEGGDYALDPDRCREP